MEIIEGINKELDQKLNELRSSVKILGKYKTKRVFLTQMTDIYFLITIHFY